jgi:hypothetical protein
MFKDIDLGDINKIISITGFIKPTADRDDKSILNVIDYNKIELSGSEPTRTSNIGKDYLKTFYSELYRARKDDDLNFLDTISGNIILNASALYDNVDEKSISLNDNVTAYRCIAGFLNRSTTFSKATGGKVINTILSNQQNSIVNTESEYANTVTDSNYMERAISGCATIKIKFLDDGITSPDIDNIVNEVNGSGLNIM